MILLKNISLIDSITFEIKKGNLLVDSTKDGAYHFIEENEIPNHAQIIECEGYIAMKAFANGHHHAYSTLARGMPFNSEAPTNFLEILERVWWKLDKNLTQEMNEISAYFTAISSAKNGVSAIIDHHASPFAISGSLNKMKTAYDKTGIDSVLCYEISDRDGQEIRDKGLEETASYLKNNDGLVGLHAAFTLSDDSLKKASELATHTKSGIHIHLAEDLLDQTHSEEKYNKRVIHRLNEFGLLDYQKSIFAHGIHLSADEKKLLKNTNSWMVQNPESNLNNEVGYFSGENLGANIMLGTDGMHSNMLQSAKTAYFTGKNFEKVDMMDIYNRLRATHRYLESQFNSTSHSLVIMDYKSPTPISQSNFLGHFFFGFENSQIKYLINHGELVLREGELVNIDETSILKEAQSLAKYLWTKL